MLHLVTMETIPSTKDDDKRAYLLLGLSVALPDQLPCRERGGMLLVNDTQGTQTQPELQCRKEGREHVPVHFTAGLKTRQLFVI